MEIRPYIASDEKAVAALWREVFPDAPAWNEPEKDIKRKLTVQREFFLVAVDGGKLIGTAMAGFDGHRGWVYYVAVSPSHRRRGVGAALMQRVEKDLVEFGCPKLNLQVRSSNEEAKGFYIRLGYQVEDRISMAKRLPGNEETTRRDD